MDVTVMSSRLSHCGTYIFFTGSTGSVSFERGSRLRKDDIELPHGKWRIQCFYGPTLGS